MGWASGMIGSWAGNFFPWGQPLLKSSCLESVVPQSTADRNKLWSSQIRRYFVKVGQWVLSSTNYLPGKESGVSGLVESKHAFIEVLWEGCSLKWVLSEHRMGISLNLCCFYSARTSSSWALSQCALVDIIMSCFPFNIRIFWYKQSCWYAGHFINVIDNDMYHYNSLKVLESKDPLLAPFINT